MNIVAIIQARCGSTRFPNKVFAELANKPLIWHIVNRLKFSKKITDIVLATTDNPLDDKLIDWAISNDVTFFRGNEDDVLNRYAEALKFANADIIVRVTADDPFKDPLLIDTVIEGLIKTNADFACNNNPPTYPEGLDVEVFTKDAILNADEKANTTFEREHVTQYFYHNPDKFRIVNVNNKEDISHLRWTIDTEQDYQMAKKVYSLLYKYDNEIFYMNDILNLLNQHPEISKINIDVARSEMYKLK